MLGRSSTRHPPEHHRLSEYLCRKSLELRVSNLSLLQETMIRESHFKRDWQFCSHPLNHTAMINTNHILKGTLPVLLASIVFVNIWLISPSSWWNFLHLLVIRVLDTESSSLTAQKMRFNTSNVWQICNRFAYTFDPWQRGGQIWLLTLTHLWRASKEESNIL